ncbi:unnamed protein product [Thelazia callipaeda]|uniref:NopRA1 domain-containing protein n=1 Tax=Thelazia callipaeda TaxID=103827 RepID=A0A0N5CUU8_THECL|nr:unnamed protein product [Thelazia callipaeda]
MKRKKLHGREYDDNVVNNIIDAVVDNRNLNITLLLTLRDCLQNLKDDESKVQLVKSRIEQKFLIVLLCQYGAMQSERDKTIFDILSVLERSYQTPLKPLFPLVWGERAKDNYDKLRQLGQALHTKLTTDQVLDYLNPKLMWNTLLGSEQTTAVNMFGQENSNQLYDARFILRLLATLISDDSEMNFRKFIDVNGLSFAFAATAFVNRSERCIAYFVLSRFLSRLTKLNSELLAERCLYIYLLQIFKNSIQTPMQRLPHAVAHFFARVTKLILHPEDPVYQPVMSFLLLKPSVDIGNVPEIYKLLLSSSTQYHNEERHWCLRLILDSLIEPNDYNILQKRYGIKLFLSLFGSIVADRETKKYILLCLRSILVHRSVANDLYIRQNFQSWIVLTFQDTSLTRWERVFLCQLFITLISHVKELHCKGSTEIKGAKLHKDVVSKTCEILGKKVCEELEKENDDGKYTWLPKLRKLLCE